MRPDPPQLRASAARDRRGNLDANPATRAEQLKIFEQRQVETQKAVADLLAAVSSANIPPEARNKVSANAAVETKCSPVASTIVQALSEGRHDDAVRQIEMAFTPALNQLAAAIHDYTALTEQRTDAYVEETASSLDCPATKSKAR